MRRAVDDGLRSDPTVWLLPTGARAQKSEMSHLQKTSFQQQDARYKTAQRHPARAAPETGQKTGPLAPNSCHEQIDGGTRYYAPIYELQNKSMIVEETAAIVDSRGSYAMKRSLTRIKAPTNWDRSPASPQRQTSQTARRSNQQHSASPNSGAVRNKSTECNAFQRPNVMKADADQSARRAVRPSHTNSATATGCSMTPAALSHTDHQLQRKTHMGKTPETEPPLKRVQTYSVKKPLPCKAGSAALRRHTSPSVKNLPETSYVSQSSESLYTQIPDRHWQQNDIDNNYHNARHSPRSEKLITSGAASTTRSRPKLAALPGTLTPKPSIDQLRNARMEHSLQRSPRSDPFDDVMLQRSLQQPYGQLSKARGCNKGKRDEVETGGQVSGTVHSHPSPSEQNFGSRYDNSDYYTPEQQQQQQQQQVCNEPVNYPARTPSDDVVGRQQQHQQQQQPVEKYQQASDLMSSASQQSVISCRPQHKNSRMLRQPRPTRPVPVAPSGPAGHRRASRIPRPKLGTRPSASVTSTTSKCSSVISLRSVHSELNYARPMPTERIPVSKFGMEYIVPLARKEVSLTPVDAFSIIGVTGQRKRFLPLLESVGEDLWKRVDSTVKPLLVREAQHETDVESCTVSIISSIVARPVSHAATQTHRVESQSKASRPRKKTSSLRKDKAAGKQDDGNEDYSGLLVRLVQLLYLQTKLNASKGDKSNSATNEAAKSANKPATASPPTITSAPPITSPPTVTHSTLLEHLQKQKQLYPASYKSAQKTNALPYSPDQGAKVYRTGSSVTQVYSKNYNGGHLDGESANSWSNATKSRTIYFDNAQSETKPRLSYQSPTTAAFKPNFNQWHHYADRYSRISSYPGMRYG